MEKISMTLIITVLFLSTSCMYAVRYDASYSGRVLDAHTGEPIEGVVVLGTWYAVMHTAAGGVHKYYDARETVTDKNGEFKIPGQGLRVMSNLEPVNLMIFKAGYEYMDYSWETLKGDKTLKDKIKWEDNKVIISLKKLTMDERDMQGSPPDPPTYAPLEKVILMLREIDKDDVERGLKPRGIWGGEKYE